MLGPPSTAASTSSPTTTQTIPPPSWKPTKYARPPVPPEPDHRAQAAFTAELAFRAANDSYGHSNRDPPNKKLKARRTIDYFGETAKYNTLRRIRPNPTYVPHPRPDPEFVIDLLPPAAYASNSSTSLCEKFVHSSVNKIRSPVNVVTWTPEGRRVLTGAQSGEFTLWNGLAFNFETILQAHDSPIRSIAWSRSSRYLLSSDDSGQIKYFQSNMNNLAILPGHAGHSCRGLSFGSGDSRFVSAGDDGFIRIWGFEERREERGWRGHGQDVRCVDWHPTKGLIVSGSTDDKVSFWDPRSGQALASYLHKNSVLACSWNPNGNLVATASRDTSVRIFDIRTFKELEVFKGHKKDVASLAWHPIHHDLLTSGDFSGTIIHWTLSSPTPRTIIDNAHESQVSSLDWHPLGHVLASGSNDFTTRFWCRGRPADEDPSNGGAAGYGGGGGLGGGAYSRVLNADEKRKAAEAIKAQAAMEQPVEEFVLPGLSNYNQAPFPLGGGGGPPAFGANPNLFPPLPPPGFSNPSDGGVLPGFGGAPRPDQGGWHPAGPPPPGAWGGPSPHQMQQQQMQPPSSWSSGAGYQGGQAGGVGGGGGFGGGGAQQGGNGAGRGGAGFQRRGGPLPSQEEMLQGFGGGGNEEGDRNGWGARGRGRGR